MISLRKLVAFLTFGIAFAYDCAEEPARKQCANYEFSETDVKKDIDSLCTSMGNMPGCSLRKACEDGFKSEKTCASVSILANLCHDMPSMSGCGNYGKICLNNNTVVKQCTDFPPLTYFSSTRDLTMLVQGICSDMYMAGCEADYRSLKTDLLGVYSKLCLEMPEMNQCGTWKSMCTKLGPSFPYCVRDSNSPPQMRMYFHTGLSDYILFKGWVPRSPLEYAASFIVIIAMGILYEFLLTVRRHYEATWSQESNDKLLEYSRRQFCIDSLRGVLQFIESSLAYLLMLISMTFNVGLFFAVILGISLGTFCFSRFRVYDTTKRPCGC